jgi:hypothetical protein
MVAILFDAEARERYSKSPFHLDDRSQLNIALLAQMFRQSSSTAATKLLKETHRYAIPIFSQMHMEHMCFCLFMKDGILPLIYISMCSFP